MKAVHSILFTACSLAGTALAAPPATGPATHPSDRAALLNAAVTPANTLFESQRRNVKVQRDMYEAMPVVATYRLDEIVSLTLIDGFFRADFGGPAEVSGQSRFGVEGTDSTWVSRVVPNASASGQFNYISRFDFDRTADGQSWQTTVSCNDTHLSITSVGIGASIHYQQSNGKIFLNALRYENGRYRSLVQLVSPSLSRMQAEHPAEVREFLVPLLRRWTDANPLRPGAADVYGVFAELSAPAETTTHLLALLPGLDAAALTDRDAASAALVKLGRAGVQSALKVDRAALSLEQVDRLDTFIASERRRSVDDPAALRREPTFLIECLEDEDPAVRVTAKKSLEEVVGHAVAFDLQADAGQRSVTAERLRDSLKAELGVAPTTRPGVIN